MGKTGTKTPEHVAIILDGNRRYARKNKKPVVWGHEKGARNVSNIVSWCQELGVKELSLYSFSTENFNRSVVEKKVLFTLFSRAADQILKPKNLRNNKARIKFVGDIAMFSKSLQEKMEMVERATAKNTGLRLNLCMAYGGRGDIVQAVKKIIGKKINKNKVSEKLITDNLYLSSEPDLMIRPGGEQRISNFLIWQNSYAELYFSNKMWPEFTKTDFKKALAEYKKRQRRYGK